MTLKVSPGHTNWVRETLYELKVRTMSRFLGGRPLHPFSRPPTLIPRFCQENVHFGSIPPLLPPEMKSLCFSWVRTVSVPGLSTRRPQTVGVSPLRIQLSTTTSISYKDRGNPGETEGIPKNNLGLILPHDHPLLSPQTLSLSVPGPPASVLLWRRVVPSGPPLSRWGKTFVYSYT